MHMTVIDSIMGSGKTTWMIDRINREYDESLTRGFDSGVTEQAGPFLYITPSLDEVDRVVEACHALDFRQPEQRHGRKYYDLERLIDEGQNICSTHSLFQRLTRGTAAALKERGYTLVIDEALDSVRVFTDLSSKDREHLINTQMVTIDEASNRLVWNEDKDHDYTGRFSDIKELCRNGNLFLSRGAVLLWEFPSEFLKSFDRAFILTYLFHGSPMSSYLAASGIDYELMAIQDKALVRWKDVQEGPIKAKLRKLITIYEGPGNKVGTPTKDKEHPLSSTWFSRTAKSDPRKLDSLKASAEHFFKSIAGTPSKVNCWTTFKDMRKKLEGKRYARCFLPCNLKATNDHIEKQSMAYLCNIFHHPHIKDYFTHRGIPVYEDLHALSEMVQWLWRTQIRRFNPIHVYVPSERMRRLLIDWLEAETVEDLFQRMGYGRPLKGTVSG